MRNIRLNVKNGLGKVLEASAVADPNEDQNSSSRKDYFGRLQH
jgi:hypothetical protein